MKHLLIALCLTLPLSASFEKYLKPALDKGDNHTMRNIDFIYMINLDERPEKWAMATANLAPYGITPYRFSAINGWRLPVDVLNDIGVTFEPGMKKGIKGTSYLPENNGKGSHHMIDTYGQNYFCHCMAKGQIGAVLSYLSVLKDAYDSGYQTIWVMEDDVEVRRNPHMLSDYIDELDRIRGKNWDILFTDRDTRRKNGEYIVCKGYPRRPNYHPEKERFRKKKDISKHLRRIGNRFGSYSMIIRRRGILKLLEFYQRYSIFFPIDMDYLAPSEMKAYTVRDDIVVHTMDKISDVGNARSLRVQIEGGTQ